MAPDGMRLSTVFARMTTNGSGDPTVDSPQGVTCIRSTNTYTFTLGQFRRLLYADPGFTANPTGAPTVSAAAGTVAFTYSGTQNSLNAVNAMFVAEV